MTVIDGFPLIFSPGGVRSYIISLLRAINNPKINNSSKNFILLIPRLDLIPIPNSLVGEIKGKAIEIRYIDINLPAKLIRLMPAKRDSKRRFLLYLWAHQFFPKEIKKLNPDVVFHPYQVVSNYKSNYQKITVIHDIFHWTHAERYSKLEKFLYNSFKSGCVNSDIIITVSQTSKQAISSYLDVPPEKIKVLYEGVNEIFTNIKFDKNEADEIKTKYLLPARYIFGFISARSYKNSLGNIKVFHELLAHEKNLKLVLLGGNINTNKKVKDYIEKHALVNEIVFVERIENDNELFYLYNLSEVFLFLSYEEGFGLPPLEALASNSLPLVSKKSSMEEIYAGYLPTFDPDDPKSIASYIISLKNEAKEKMINKAKKELLPKYSWEKVLGEYLKYL